MRTHKRHLLTALTTVIVTTVILSPCAFGQEKLDAMVAYSLKKIPPRLEKAEKLADQGDLPNATVYLEEARKEWDTIHKDFKGKFNEDHPDIVAVRKQLQAVTAKVAGAAEPDKDDSAEPVKTADSSVTGELPSTMVYEMKQFGPVLDDVESCIKSMELDAARQNLQSAQHEWDTKKKWNKGTFDPKHPDVVALDNRFAEVTKKVNQLEARAGTAAENLPAALEAVTENSKRLYETYDKARSAIRNLSSLRSDFDRGSEDDIGKLQEKMDAVRLLVERVNALLPDSLAAARAFREQYPDFEVLDKLVRKGTRFQGREAGNQVKRLEEFPVEWLREVSFVINEALDEARNNIAQYGTGRLDRLEGSDEALKTSAADAAEHWVLDYSSVMLEIIDTLLPELPEDAQASLPELVAARQDFLKRAAGMEADIKKVAKAISGVRNKVVEARLRRLKEARFPKSTYTGGKWKDAENAIRTAWKQKIEDKELVSVSIYDPWEVRSEARWVNGRWVVGTYRYIGANCLAKLPSGTYMVYRMLFRNTRQEDGSWSPLEQWSVGHVYEILKENIDK
jgi:hypothetical protein